MPRNTIPELNMPEPINNSRRKSDAIKMAAALMVGLPLAALVGVKLTEAFHTNRTGSDPFPEIDQESVSSCAVSEVPGDISIKDLSGVVQVCLKQIEGDNTDFEQSTIDSLTSYVHDSMQTGA